MLERFYNWLLQFIQSTLTFAKILIRSNLGLKSVKAKANTCIIMGNGPSIKATLTEDWNKLQKHTLICVNHFPETDQFVELQPLHCVVGAKENWRADSNQATKDKAARLFHALVEKTTWKMYLHLPYEAKKVDWLMQQFQQNPNLKLTFFNDTPVEGLPSINHFFFKKNWGMPRPHNVLIPSLMIAINAGFKKIFIVGADHSWLEELTVDEHNQALLHQRHFYDEDASKPDQMYKLGKRPRRLHEILEKFMLAFKAYFEIDDYAQSLGAKIWNSTPKSYIDAFERRKLMND